MKCADYQKLISDRLDGSLSLAEQERLEAHLKICPTCRLYEKELKAIDGKARKLSAEEPDIPPGLEAGLRERLIRVEAEKRINRNKSRFIKWAPAWAAGLFLVMATAYLVFFRTAEKEQNLDLAMVMSFEDSYLVLTQAINDDESLKEKYNEEILNSIYKEVPDPGLESWGRTEDYIEQIINDNDEYILLPENTGFPEGK